MEWKQLHIIGTCLLRAEREGAEGARHIKISDTLAHEWGEFIVQLAMKLTRPEKFLVEFFGAETSDAP